MHKSIYGAICESLNSEGSFRMIFFLPFNKTSPNQLRFIPESKRWNRHISFWRKSSEEVSKKIVKLLKMIGKRAVSAHKMKLPNFCVNAVLCQLSIHIRFYSTRPKGIDIDNLLDLLAGLHFSLLMRNWSSWA